MNNQNKAPQTVEVRGVADNAFMALSVQTKRGFIIAKNLIKPNLYSNNLLGFGVGVGYSGGSKNQCSTQRLNRCFFVPSFYRGVSFDALREVFGGVGKAQAPRCHWQLEHPHLYTVAINLKTNGGLK